MAVIECNGAPARDKWMALEQQRPEPGYWVTIRCPHTWVVNVPLGEDFWSGHPDAPHQIATIWRNFQRWCRHCRTTDPPPLVPLIYTALARPGVAVYRSLEELAEGIAE